MADLVTRAWALAIATAACIGLPSALVYAAVRIAAARRYGATFALGLVLVFWVTISAAYYPRVCADLLPCPPRFPRLRRARRRRGPRGELSLPVPQQSSPSFVIVDVFPPQVPPATARGGGRGGARVRADDAVGSAPPYPYEHRRVPSPQRNGLFPWEARGGASAGGAADDDVPLPPPPPPPTLYPSYTWDQQYVALARSQGDDDDHASTTRGMMAALPREPPAAARGRARAGVEDDDDVNGVVRPSCEGQSDKCCVICLIDVDTEETAKRLPLCRHVFHRHCIDQWLRANSTCPICRCNVRLHDSTVVRHPQ